MRRLCLCAALFALFAPIYFSARQQPAGAYQQLGRSILKELIETNTTHSTGNVTTAAERVSARLIAAGFPKEDVQIVGAVDKKRNLVARYRGTGKRKPILFIAHLDVV